LRMKERIRSLFKSEFAKNVLTLMTGTLVGQLVSLAMAPIITRLFTPDDFTTLEQFTMITTVAIVIVTGKYEFAIMQANTREEARRVLLLVTKVALYSCSALLILSFFLSDFVAGYYNNPVLGKWLWLMPITLFATAVFTSINYWFTKQKKYKVVASSKVWFSVASEPLKIGTGFLKSGGGGLLWSTLVGNLLATAIIVKQFFNDEPKGFRRDEDTNLMAVAKEYKEYPLYSIWGSILNRLAQWAHIGVFSHYYGVLAIGYMALCRRIFLNPLNIFSNSFSQVFFQKISVITDPKKLQHFYHQNVLRFLAFSSILVVGVYLLPDNTMGFLFGEEWKDTLKYLRLLSWWYALNFVTSCLSFMIHRLRMQRVGLFLDAIHFVFVYGAIIGAFTLGCDEMQALRWLVISKVVYFSLNIVVVLFYLRKHTEKNMNAV